MPTPVRFLFDFLSPYAYLAWSQIHGLAQRHGRTVQPEPVLLAALLDTHGQLGPAEIPAKRTYVFRDVLRSARVLGLQLRPPPAHPFNPLLGLRIAALDLSPQDRFAVIDALFGAVWEDGRGITDPDAVAAVLTDRDLDGPALIAAAGTPDAKQRLKALTQQALDDGVFGVPSIIADGELFWGFDSMGHLDRFLANGGEPPSAELLARFDALEPQATRRR
jgi:2-hydroxychromene-2-carboxylate isomerase